MIGEKGLPDITNDDFNFLFDGNSLVEWNGQYLENKFKTLPLLNGKGFPIYSIGISGQSWTAMASGISDVRFNHWPKKRNILFAWEGTNQLTIGSTTPQQAIDAMLNYINTVKSTQDWEIYVITTIPRFGTGRSNFNELLVEYDNLLRNNWKAYGLAGIVDVRMDGSPFKFTTYNQSDFERVFGIYIDSGTHLTPFGTDFIAELCHQKLRGLGRAPVIPAPTTDKHLASVALMLNGQGANNGTVFTDTSPNNRTISRLGSVVTSTVQKKFGVSSLFFDGSTAALFTADQPNLRLGSNDYTFEAWIYPTSSGNGTTRGIYTKRNSNTGARELRMYLNNSNQLVTEVTNDATGWYGQTSAALTPDQWHHVAAIRIGGVIRSFANGGRFGSSFFFGDVSSSTENATVGALGSNGEAPFRGYMHFRMTNGVARYANDFNPPLEFFEN